MSESQGANKAPFYNPKLSYEENYENGPFGVFAEEGIFFNEGQPKYEVFGIKVHLPFGIPAGPLLNEKYVNAAFDKGFNIPVYKTVRTKSKDSHPYPNVVPIDVEGDLTLEKAKGTLTTKEEYKDPLSITNSFGVPSKDAVEWQQGIREAVAHKRKGQMLWVSVEGTKWPGYSYEDYVNDWVLAAKLAKEAGADVIEANLSCPNEGTSNLLCFDTERVEEISLAIKNEIGDTPLVLKTAYFENQDQLKELVLRVGGVIDGFASINTISATVINPDGTQALPGKGREKSGVCGDSIRWAGLDMVKRLSNLRDEFGMGFTIVGVGGVNKPEHFVEYRDAGADVVMSATGAMWNPYLAQEIKESLGK